jgi:transcriptional regulator with XRE-family HTH domain
VVNTMENKSIFAKNLKRYMEINGKTRRDICQALDLSYYTVSDWCNAKKYPRMDKVELLANYFGIQKSDLIEEKNVEEMTKDAGMHARILMDRDLLDLIKIYYSLSDRDQKIVRSFVKSFDE